MKRLAAIVIILALCLAFGSSAVAAPTLLDMHNKILEESVAIKSLLSTSKDVYLINNMWDSCVLLISQLDAYFSMLGIFNTIKRENQSQTAVDYLIKWLEEIRRSNELNIKSLNTISDTIDPATKVHLENLKGYFADFNTNLNTELSKLTQLRKSIRRQ
jgi:hypothetical protein